MLVEYYNNRFPDANVMGRTSSAAQRMVDPNLLVDRVRLHHHLILDGRQISPPSKKKDKANNAIVQTRFGHHSYIGQVVSVYSHQQRGIPGRSTLLYVRWFRPLRPGLLPTEKWYR